MKKRLHKLALKTPRLIKRGSDSEEQGLENVPRITNETVAEHREEVLKGARKYIYPLQHSKHRIVLVTATIIVTALVGFLLYCVAGLYRFKQTNAFLYRVTQVIPFPIARTGSTLISYENYLFEVRHYQHYYQTQIQRYFDEEVARRQFEDYRRKALDDVVNDAYVKKIAKERGISVDDGELQARIEMVRSQNRLGSDNRVFSDVLKEYWGWSVRDFERSLRQQMLTEKVRAALDSTANQRAQSALAQLRAGANFAELAKQVSDDPTAKSNGGDYGLKIDKANRDIAPQIIDALFGMKPGEVSDIINTGGALEIVRLTETSGDRVSASHIVFNLKNTDELLAEFKKKQPVNYYVTF